MFDKFHNIGLAKNFIPLLYCSWELGREESRKILQIYFLYYHEKMTIPFSHIFSLI